MNLDPKNLHSKIFALARDGHLDQIPAHLLTSELFATKSYSGMTPLHWAAKNGHLDQVPAHLLTPEMLSTQNDEGRTPLHYAAETGRLLKTIPYSLLTMENLTVADNDGQTPAQIAVRKDPSAIVENIMRLPLEVQTVFLTAGLTA
jgi:ankyrin repeat protein